VRLVLIGGGGHARVVADVARSAGFELLGVLTPEGTQAADGLERIGDDSWIDSAPDDVGFHLAFGGAERAGQYQRLRGTRAFPALVSPAAFVSPSARTGDGTLVVHGAIVNGGAEIGENAIVNTRALVEHDCWVGDHSHIAPGAVLAGGAKVGAGCLIGVGAVLLPGVSIADGVTIGAGAIVVESVRDEGSIWSGNPARRHG
jgi:UDP-perosamine 4-acetyltransferase